MFKKLTLSALCLLGACQLEANTVSLKTGRWVFDRYRNVDLNSFDYFYQIQSRDTSRGVLELTDGSLWQVAPMADETQSFYYQFYALESTMNPLQLFALWDEGDTLIFHKLVDRPTLIAYNVTKDRVLDVLPVSSPTTPALTIVSINNTNDISYSYSYDHKNNRLDQYQSNNWKTVIALSDGSVFEGNPSKPLVAWVVGDPIHIAKDSPWWSSNTHILMNFKPTRGRPDAAPTFRRLGTWRAG